ncbi:MAG: hypothetical protein Aurels2KO_03710 [Aureliella sp.]
MSTRLHLTKRRGAASLELVLVTAVALPLAVALLLLGAKMAAYVYAGLSGLTTMPWL